MRDKRCSSRNIRTIGMPVLLIFSAGIISTLLGCSRGITPLMNSVKDKSPAQITALLEAGADVNAQSKDGWTALMIAAEYNPDPKVLTMLIDAGAQVNMRDRLGASALMAAAAKNQNPEVINTLI